MAALLSWLLLPFIFTLCNSSELSCREVDICHLYASCVEMEGMDQAICVCDEGYQGDGTNCYKSANTTVVCAGHDQCPNSKTCVQGLCRDPCEGLCGDNTSCKVRLHTPACACKAGYTGDPFSGCSPDAAQRVCPKVASETWPPTKKRFYVALSNKVTWIGAFLGCLRNNSRLASIDNMDEFEEIRHSIHLTGVRLGNFWLSALDFGYEGHYVWINTGKTMTKYTDMWESLNPEYSKPPDTRSSRYDCVEMWERYEKQGYLLNDRSCKEVQDYICEYYS